MEFVEIPKKVVEYKIPMYVEWDLDYKCKQKIRVDMIQSHTQSL